MVIDYEKIGAKIKIARMKNGLTQSQLAELLAVSSEYISRVERATTHISLKKLIEITGHLNVSAGYILEGSTTTDPSYTLNEFSEILLDLSPEKRKLLLEIAKVVVDHNYK